MADGTRFVDPRVIDMAGLRGPIDVPAAGGYAVIGPTVLEGSIGDASIRSVDEIPRGWGDKQESAHSRLRRRDDHALGFAVGAQSAKQVPIPTDEQLWRGRRIQGRFTVHPESDAAGTPTPARNPPYALIGVRSRDLHAIAHDRVLTGRVQAAAHYTAQRADAFNVAVGCSDPWGTCFCACMGTGPRPEGGPDARYDLALTEFLVGGRRRFLFDGGSERGAEVLAELGTDLAAPRGVAAAADAATATGRMGRTLQTDGPKELLCGSEERPHRDDVAARCLACANCTMVCPTWCCTAVNDVSDLTGDAAEGRRVWDSCFDGDFSYIHGGTVRESTRSGHRQWMAHELASWVDQFGTSGCGGCITWCRAAIDITAEAACRGVPQTYRPF